MEVDNVNPDGAFTLVISRFFIILSNDMIISYLRAELHYHLFRLQKRPLHLQAVLMFPLNLYLHFDNYAENSEFKASVNF